MKVSRQNQFKKLPLIVAGVILVAFGALAFYAQNQHIASQQTMVQLSLKPTIPKGAISTGDGSYATTTKIPGQMKFVSPKLGISFLYTSANPKEVGNKVSLEKGYPDPSIEVFQKDPNDTLSVTINKDFLNGYSEHDCFIENNVVNYKNYHYETAAIVLPHHFNLTPQEIFEKSKKCPTTYIRANNGRYFAYDKTHPNKYVFINISQWNISSGNERPNPNGVTHVTGWDETLQFFN